MAGTLTIAADAVPGPRGWRVWTSQGVTPANRFVVGDLPEVAEKEVPGEPIPERVAMPITVNGRVFPHEDVDLWTVAVKKGQSVTAVVEAGRLGSPLDARLEVRDPDGRPVVENDDTFGPDPAVRFTASADGVYQIKIHDINFKGSQAHVYRLTLTAGPHVDRVFPLGGRRGAKTAFRLAGQGLPDTPQTVAIPADAAAPYLHCLEFGGQTTNAFALDVDDLPEYVEGDAPVTVPAVVNGFVSRPGESDRIRFAAKKGDVLDVELRAKVLDSALTGILTVEDVNGKVLAKAEASVKADPSLRFTAPADATYTVVVAERFRSLGGPEYAYRLRLASPRAAQDFSLQVKSDALTVPRGGEFKLPLTVEFVGGFKQAIALKVEGLPAGVTVTGTELKAGQDKATLVFKAAEAAKVGTSAITIRGSAALDGKEATRTAVAQGELPLDTLRLAVAMPTPFKVVGKYEMGWAARGSVAKRSFQIERTGYDGPLTVRLADRQARHLQGVTAPTITVPAGATEFEYPVTLPPWMEMGRTCRVCVMAEGIVAEADGTKHTVSFSSVNQNEQLVAVVEAGFLDLTTDVASLRAEPGTEAVVPVRLTRGKGLEGPVRVELAVPEHVRGVVASAITVPADRNTGALSIRFEARPGPFNVPLTLRATLAGKNGPVTAEVPLDVAAAGP
jgi:hypothetical protein